MALQPDCVVYAASGPDRDAAAVPDYVRLLEAGINVVTTSSTRLIYPPAFDPTMRDQLERRRPKPAARRSTPRGSSPASCSTSCPLVLATQLEQHPVDPRLRDRALRRLPRRRRDDGRDGLRPARWTSSRSSPSRASSPTSGPAASASWPTRLGVEVEEIRERVERAPTDRTLEVACGTLEAGTSGGDPHPGHRRRRRAARRSSSSTSPAWPPTSRPSGRPAEHDVGYRIEIEGEPEHPRATCTARSTTPPRAGIRGHGGRRRGDGGHRDARRERDSVRRRRRPGPAQLRSTSRSRCPATPFVGSECRTDPAPRVVVWSTGGIGSNAIRAIARRPDLELVGVWVHTPEKVGRDAGELAGIAAARPRRHRRRRRADRARSPTASSTPPADPSATRAPSPTTSGCSRPASTS